MQNDREDSDRIFVEDMVKGIFYVIWLCCAIVWLTAEVIISTGRKQPEDRKWQSDTQFAKGATRRLLWYANHII